MEGKKIIIDRDREVNPEGRNQDRDREVDPKGRNRHDTNIITIKRAAEEIVIVFQIEMDHHFV